MEPDSNLLALILGAIQGVTEFLPVSSSGHLIIVSWFLDGKPLPLAMNIALHLGTLTSVLVFFWRDWLKLGRGVYNFGTKRERSFESHVLFPGLIIGSIPAGVVGILWEDKIEEIFHNPLSVAIPLALVGWLIWWIDIKRSTDKTINELSIKHAFMVGVAQAFALIPGVSRSGSTIMGGRFVGLGREDAAKFSFILGTPALCGAALLKSREIFSFLDQPSFYVGFLSSAIVGALTISFFLKLLKRFGFLSFAIYRTALALVIIGLSWGTLNS